MKTLKNKANWWKEINDEHICWVIGVKKFDAHGDMKYYKNRVESMLDNYMDAEKQYQWNTGKQTKSLLKQLINSWRCGMIVTDSKLKTKNENPIQFVCEYYKENYPKKEIKQKNGKKIQFKCMYLW